MAIAPSSGFSWQFSQRLVRSISLLDVSLLVKSTTCSLGQLGALWIRLTTILDVTVSVFMYIVLIDCGE
jgi:hypothetical protein